MLSVTEKAQAEIVRYFESNPVQPIRVFLNNSCCGAQLAMAIDEARSDDKTFDIAGIQYLVNVEFLAQAQPIEIDYAPQGFSITSRLELGGDCGGCGSSGNGCRWLEKSLNRGLYLSTRLERWPGTTVILPSRIGVSPTSPLKSAPTQEGRHI